jgi:fused signal recognition particle receptor
MALFDKFKRDKKTDIAEDYDEVQASPEPAAAAIPADDGKTADMPAATGPAIFSEEQVEPKNSSSNKSKEGLIERFKLGLSKTRKNIGDKIDSLIKSTRKLDDEFYEGLEDILIQADVGMNTSLELVSKIKTAASQRKINEPAGVMELIQEEIAKLLGDNPQPLKIAAGNPAIILVVGVNGAGKTTSIAKLAYRLKNENKQVMLAAGDTFRAAAIDQLQIWADRVGVELIKHQEGSDPGAVVYDAINAARARKADVLIIDTAGRLQNKTNLMKEIGKVRKVIEREMPDAPHEVLLVLDATTGQNAVSQAKLFGEATGVSGIILTKLDGTAKGGIVIAVAKELNIPVKMIGIGENLEDLRDFSPEIFAQALFAK